MRGSVQLVVCALVGLAASPVAFSLPMRGALYGRDPQGELTSGPANSGFGGETFGPSDPGSGGLNVGPSDPGPGGLTIGPSGGPGELIQGPPAARDETSPPVELVSGGILLPVPSRRAPSNSNPIGEAFDLFTD